MEKILVIETSRDNLEIGMNYFLQLTDIPDLIMRQAVVDAINGINAEQKLNDVQTYDKLIFSNSYGYYFGNLPRTNPPYQVQYVIQHCIE